VLKKYLMTVVKHLKQVKVVHHLPGRLRLHISLLERLSSEWCRYQADLIEIIKLKRGIIDIEMSIISGRVLIYYEPEHTGKSQILQWFKDLALTLCEAYAGEPFQSKRQIPAFLEKMRAQALRLLQEEHHLGENA
jgi:hypothetical protein